MDSIRNKKGGCFVDMIIRFDEGSEEQSVTKKELCSLLNKKVNENQVVKVDKSKRLGFEVIEYKNPIIGDCKVRMIFLHSIGGWFSSKQRKEIMEASSKIVGDREVVIDYFGASIESCIGENIFVYFEKIAQLVVWDYKNFCSVELPKGLAINNLWSFDPGSFSFWNGLEKKNLVYRKNLYYFPDQSYLKDMWCSGKTVALRNIKQGLKDLVAFAEKRMKNIPEEYHKHSALLMLIKKENQKRKKKYENFQPLDFVGC